MPLELRPWNPAEDDGTPPHDWQLTGQFTLMSPDGPIVFREYHCTKCHCISKVKEPHFHLFKTHGCPEDKLP